MKLTPLCCSQSQKYPPFGLPLAVGHGPPKASVSRAIPSGSFKEFDSVKKKVPMQITHSMPPQKLEIIKSLETWAQKNLLTHLKPVEKCWQPNDYVPDSTSEDFYEQVKELRARSQDIPDDLFVILVGNMITEEALPTYQTMFNTIDGCRDETGTSLSPWAVWSRSWTAEENRHGDLLNRYLYLYITGPWDGKRPLPSIHIHLVPRKGNRHLSRKHSKDRKRAWGLQTGSDMRDNHCR